MPRRKHPVKKIAVADAREAEALRPAIFQMMLARGGVFTRMSKQQQNQLADQLVHAVGYAKAGLTDILAGKGVKPAAWVLDIFVKDVCDALAAAGVPVLMDPAPESSHAQSFAKELAEAAGLSGHGKSAGNLFKQMQRARKIIKQG